MLRIYESGQGKREGKSMAGENTQEPLDQETGKRSALQEFLALVDVRNWWQYNRFVDRLPFLLFCTFLAGFYIWNRHTFERQVRELDRLNRELTEMRWYYDTAKDELARHSRQSSVADRVAARGILELTQPPLIIAEEKSNKR